MTAARPLALALVAALAAASPAAAIDLTGSWLSPKVLCKGRNGLNGLKLTEMNGDLAFFRIKQVGTTLWIETNGVGDPAYDNKFLGAAITDPASAEKGYGAASACTVVGKQNSGGIQITKAKADATSGKLTLVFTGNYRFGSTATCKGTFFRESADDPGLTLTCP